MTQSFLDGLGLQIQMTLVLNQFPRNSRHVSRLPCEDVPIFLKEFDEHIFLFRIQGVVNVSNLGRLLCGQRDQLAECVLQLDGHFGGLGLGHDRVWGDSAKACFSSWSSMDAVSLLVVSQLSLSQSKARLTSPLMEMMPHGPSIFKTK
jgi:hypothetical protein